MRSYAAFCGIMLMLNLACWSPPEPTAGKENKSAPAPKTESSAAAAPRHGEVQVFDLGDGVRLEMVYVTGGKFQMGSPDSEAGRRKNEGPVHTVALDGFYIGKYEVTQEQYETIMGKIREPFGGPRNPAECLSWDDATEFCARLSQKTAKTFRLPTEAEWEYACRAGSSARFCFGDSDKDLGEYAWYHYNMGSRPPNPVGQKKPNAWGLYDMHGGLLEWCSDWYDENYYKSSPKKNPSGPPSGSSRALRGGSWLYEEDYCRSAFRDEYDFSLSRHILVGFRVVCVSGGLTGE